MQSLEIRLAKDSDAANISQLITSLAHRFTIEPDGSGAQRFLESVTPAAIARCIDNPDFLYLVGLAERELVGVVAVRGGTHLFHLFVADAWQRKGVATRLWQHARALADAAPRNMPWTVNATPNALPVYERFGFIASGERMEKNGVLFVPMTLVTIAER